MQTASLHSRVVRENSAEPQHEAVSERLRLWLSGDAEDLSRRAKRETARRAGSMAALAAMIVDVSERESRTAVVAVAKPLTLQPAVFTALASELHFLTDLEVAFRLINSAGSEKSWRWASPRAIQRRLQSFARLLKGPDAGTDNSPCISVSFAELPLPGSKSNLPVDILLFSSFQPVAPQPTLLSKTLFVELAPLT